MGSRSCFLGPRSVVGSEGRESVVAVGPRAPSTAYFEVETDSRIPCCYLVISCLNHLHTVLVARDDVPDDGRANDVTVLDAKLCAVIAAETREIAHGSIPTHNADVRTRALR